MMVKYRLGEVAKDLGRPNKEVAEMLQKHTGQKKPSAAVLDESELNILFEAFTKQHEAKNLDAYTRRPAAQTAPAAAAPVAAEKTETEARPAQQKPRNNDRNAQPRTQGANAPKQERENRDNRNNRGDRTPAEGKRDNRENRENRDNNRTQKPQNNNAPVAAPKQPAKPAAPVNNAPKAAPQPKPAAPAPAPAPVPAPAAPQNTEESGYRKQVRIVDTRTSNVDIDKYNEKYDRMAYDKVKTETTASKQKLTQRSKQERGKPKNARRETEQERLQRIALERQKKQMTITVPEEITVGELATRLKATAAEVIKKLMMMGTFATVNDVIDYDTAELVAMEFHAKVEKEVVVTIEERIIDDSEDTDENLIPRAPVVVVMGHVDHGKTSLLDAIRNAHVTATEAGGITQHIGAYRVNINDQEITFLDTPGHAAFTTMRARGAQVTDIAVLVVAADDGIMPQTIEAINHAKAAGVSIIVAINKMDKPTANPDQVKQQLTEHEIVPEEWGGDVPCIPVSALKREGIDDLLEMITLVADMKELKANPDRAAKGTVIEARLDKGKGPVATVLVQNGTLRSGDIIVAGTTVGRVRAMTNERGRRLQEAGPSVPVEITGLDDVPTGGDVFNVVSDERLARELVEQRRNEQKEEIFNARTKVTLDNLFDQMQQGEMKELKIIVKADVQGSVEAVRQSLEKLTNEEVRVNVIHNGVGAINESDVMLANASNAIIVGFNVRPDSVAEENAKRDGVDMRLYRVIYDCIEEIEAAMKGMLAPKYRENLLGRAECRTVFKVSSVGTIAGSYVLDGKITRAALLRVVRDGIIIADDQIASLRRFKDDVKEVAQGYECGIGLERFNDLKEGDIFEVYVMEEYRD